MNDPQSPTPSPAPRPTRRDEAGQQVQDFLYSTPGNITMAVILIILVVSFILVAIGL